MRASDMLIEQVQNTPASEKVFVCADHNVDAQD